MSHRKKTISLIALCSLSALLTCALAHAEENPPKPKPDTPTPAGEAAPVDPTQPSIKLLKAATPPAKPSPVEPAKPIEPPKPTIPEIVLKALVMVEGKPSSALIELDGKNQKMISEGAELSVHGTDKQVLTLIVKKISSEGIDIEIPDLKTIIHVK